MKILVLPEKKNLNKNMSTCAEEAMKEDWGMLAALWGITVLWAIILLYMRMLKCWCLAGVFKMFTILV